MNMSSTMTPTSLTSSEISSMFYADDQLPFINFLLSNPSFDFKKINPISIRKILIIVGYNPYNTMLFR